MTAHMYTHAQTLKAKYILSGLTGTAWRVQKLGALVLDLLLECSHYWLFPFLNDKWRHVIHLAYEDPWGFW